MSIKESITVLCAVCVVAVTAAFGQTAKYQFPQNVVYPHGHISTTLTNAKAQEWYAKWKTERLKPCAGKGLMPTADNDNQVKVEGMGWAMIAAAYMGDKGVFDSLYMFYKSKTLTESGGMMGWDVSCDGFNDRGSAADGDLDVAFGLAVATWQWGDSYLPEAQKVINNCKKLIVTCDGVSAVAGGFNNGNAWGGGCNAYTDISYYTPAFFKVFAQITSDAAWTKLAEDTYTHLNRNAHATTGLVSGWQNASTGAAMNGPGGTSNDSSYNHDASRVPWRIALDYLWNGEPRAKAWAAKLTNWAYGVGVSNLKEGYNRDGTVISQTSAGFAFLGGWAVGSMVNDDAAVRTAFANAVSSRDDNYWYSRSTGNMYWLALTGNMWNEDLVGVTGFRLTAAVDGGGTVTRMPNKTKYASGDVVTLTAAQNTGWDFVGWTGDVAAGDAKKTEITIAMTADKSVTAKFQLAANGVNLVKNGDFSNGLADWTLNTWENSQATANVSSNAVTITINTLPSDGKIYNLQLVQATLPLLKGNTYVLSFEASAVSQRTMEVMCQKATNPYTGYFSDTEVSLTTIKKAFSYEFEMTEDDDNAARIGFNIGNSTTNVTISNVSVTFKGSGGSSVSGGSASFAYNKNVGMAVTAAKSAVNVKFNAKSTGIAELKLYNIRGKLLQKVKLQTVAGASYAHAFNAAKLSSGFYVVGRRDAGGMVEHVRVAVGK